MVQITAKEQNKGKRMKRIEDSLRDLQNNIKCINIQVIGISEEGKTKSLRKFLKKIQLKTSPTWERKQSIKSKKYRVPYRINTRRNISKHIFIKLTEIKHKKRILKEAREKQQETYKGKPIQLTVNLSAKTLQARRE